MVISPTNVDISYHGRVGFAKDSIASEIYWSGSGFKIDFEGTDLSVFLKDEHFQNYFNIIIDGDSITLLRPDTVKTLYHIAKNLPEGKHRVELFKRTEWTRGTTWFYGAVLNANAELLHQTVSSRSIEFYGNSITCGYGVEDYSGNDSPDSIYTNNYLSYAAITARHFNADYTCISRSGIGLTISWFNQIMQEIYARKNPNDPESVWRFSEYPKDVVVVNLFQNDSWLLKRPDHVEYKRRFRYFEPTPRHIVGTYSSFIGTLRTQYPLAHIVCLLGNMDITQAGSPWPGYVTEAVNSLNDAKIHTLFVPDKHSSGHPHIKEQQIIADELIQLIEEKINW